MEFAKFYGNLWEAIRNATLKRGWIEVLGNNFCCSVCTAGKIFTFRTGLFTLEFKAMVLRRLFLVFI